MQTPQNDAPRLPRLNLPPYNIRLARRGNAVVIFDIIRKKYVTATPEEYVRQHFVNWMINSLHYPPAIMANEVGIHVGETQRRCDTVVFSSDGTPLMIVEYKAPDVTLNQDVFDQIARYNMALHARYLVVSNGMRHYCCVMDYDNDSYQFIPLVPDYSQLVIKFSDN